MIYKELKHLTHSFSTLIILFDNDKINDNNNKAKTDKTQLNSQCRKQDKRDETINHIISECTKLA